MENKEKWIKENKKDIEGRLKLSDKKRWNTLTSEEREAVVNKYHDLRSIEHLGIDKILDDNRNARRSVASLILGVLLGVFGNMFADILIQYKPKSIGFDIFVIALSFFSLWFLIKLLDKFSADHLNQENILEYLLTMTKEGRENKT